MSKSVLPRSLAAAVGIKPPTTTPAIMEDKSFTWGNKRYPWALELFKRSRNMFWTEETIQMGPDVLDYNTRLTKVERNIFTTIMKLFTQGDISVARAYTKLYLPHFHRPEVVMMLTEFANKEGTHVSAYAYAIESLGYRDSIFDEFLDIAELRNKYDYYESRNMTGHPPESREWYLALLKNMAVFAAFTEGFHLFSTFAVLLSFKNEGLMMGTATINEWSLKDESLHVEGMLKLYNTLRYELDLTKGESRQLDNDLLEIGGKMLDLERDFLGLIFAKGNPRGVTHADMIKYVNYVYQLRQYQLGISGIEAPTYDHPLPWLEAVDGSGYIHANFFESRSTEYGMGSITGSTEDCTFPQV